VVLKEISAERWKRAYPEMGIVPEREIVVGIIVGKGFEEVVVIYSNK
jgi:hypothetical protein